MKNIKEDIAIYYDQLYYTCFNSADKLEGTDREAAISICAVLSELQDKERSVALLLGSDEDEEITQIYKAEPTYKRKKLYPVLEKCSNLI